MGLASTAARLLASLELDTKPFEAGARRAGAAISGMERRFGKIGGLAAQGARNAATNLTRVGVVAAGAITLAVKTGISSLADLEDATTSVQGAIDQVAPHWRTTAADIAASANDIEASVQAAFDDKEIVAGATGLIRYGQIAEENLRPAMVVMTDLAASTGSVDSASRLLAKALAAPEKASGRLTRQGIILTEAQQDQIEAMVEAGDKAGAQSTLLAILEERTKGAAAAMHGPYRDALLELGDVQEDTQRVLAEGFLPVIQRVASVLREKVADPAFMEQVRGFGRTLAGAFDKLLTVAGNIPWAQIGDSLKIAGTGAKALFDAFTTLPPWIQTAVLTGWGLNKLSGGALGGIVGELGKGLIKGVLGINAGVVNAKAGVVNVVGGGIPGTGPGTPTPVGTPSRLASGLKLAGSFILPVTVGAVIAEAINDAAANDPQLQQARRAREAAAEAGKTLPGARGGPGTLPELRPWLNSGSPVTVKAITATAANDLNQSGSPDERQERHDAAIAAALKTIANQSGSPDERQERNDAIRAGLKDVVGAVKDVERETRQARRHAAREDKQLDGLQKETRAVDRRVTSVRRAMEAVKTTVKAGDAKSQQKLDAARTAVRAAENAIRIKSEQIRIAEMAHRQTTQFGLSNVRATTATGADRIVAALYATRPMTTVNVSVDSSGNSSSYLSRQERRRRRYR